MVKRNKLKIADLGVSVKLDYASKTFSIEGTLSYFSPELVFGRGVNSKTDIW